MSDLAIHKVSTSEDRTLPIFAEIDRLTGRIRDRAYDLFTSRGFDHGHALDDWLAAEQQMLLPEAELVDADAEFELSLAMPGFEQIDVTATPHALIIKATRDEQAGEEAETARWTEYRHEDVYRYIALPSAIDVDKVTAKLKSGVLAIEAPKAGVRQAAAKTAGSKPAAKKKAKAKAKAKTKAKAKVSKKPARAKASAKSAKPAKSAARKKAASKKTAKKKAARK